MTALRTEARPRDAHLSFHDFVASRPDEEKWELIDGRFIMQAQPTIDHQIIAGNLDRLLNDGLERLGASRIAVQNPAIDLRPTIESHTYVPDVAVLDCADIAPNSAIMQTCYLAAEIVSQSDRRRPTGSKRQKIAIKVERYQALPACEAILLIEQGAFDVIVAKRDGSAWTSDRLTGLDDRIILVGMGLDCRVADLYARTSLMRARKKAVDQ